MNIIYRIISFYTLILINICLCCENSHLLSVEKIYDGINENKVLLLIPNAYYGSYLEKIHSYLDNITDVTRYNPNSPSPELELDEFDQIWVTDLRGLDIESSPNDKDLYDGVVQWFENKDVKNIIFDSRILHTTSFPTVTPTLLEPQVLTNYYENLKIRGGGLFVGFDHGPEHVSVANYIAEKLNFDTFAGSASANPLLVDTSHPLIGYPRMISDPPKLIGGTSIIDTMSHGLQTNGLFLYGVGWAGEIDTGAPKVTTTIPPSDYSVDLLVDCLKTIEKGERFEIVELNFFSLVDHVNIVATSNISNTFFIDETEGPIIEIDSPDVIGYHNVKIDLESSTNHKITFNFILCVNDSIVISDDECEECTCNQHYDCYINENKVIKNIVNNGTLIFNSTEEVIIKYDPKYPIIIDSENGRVKLSGNITIIIPNEVIEEKEDIQIGIISGNYNGHFDSVRIETENEEKCKRIESDVLYRERSLTVALKINDKCIKWWAYLLISLGVIIILIIVFLVIVLNNSKLKSRFKPFSS